MEEGNSLEGLLSSDRTSVDAKKDVESGQKDSTLEK